MQVPGPGTFTIKEGLPGQKFSFGSRFNSDIRSKEHLRPKKDPYGPAPGLYGHDESGQYRKSLPGSIRVHRRAVSLREDTKTFRKIEFASTMDCTFGKGKRDFSGLP
jgi:hypothetical protein